MMTKLLPSQRILIAVGIVFLLLLTACQRGGSADMPEIGLLLEIDPSPPTVGLAMLTLTLTDANGQPISDAKLDIEGNMSHAGMTPVFSQATEFEPGKYRAPLELTMGGDWFVLVKTTLPDGRTFERQLDLPGVASN